LTQKERRKLELGSHLAPENWEFSEKGGFKAAS
jgi:hypothetical protein